MEVGVVFIIKAALSCAVPRPPVARRECGGPRPPACALCVLPCGTLVSLN